MRYTSFCLEAVGFIVSRPILWSVMLMGCFGSELLGQAPIFVSPAAFTDVVDRDGDGHASRFAIEYQLQGYRSEVELNVFASIHRRSVALTSHGPWEHVFTSPEYTVQGRDYGNAERIEVQSSMRGVYEYRISGFIVGRQLPVTRVLVGELQVESSGLDRDGIRLSQFDDPPRFVPNRDIDRDGFPSDFSLEYTLGLNSEGPAVSVYEKLYSRTKPDEAWRLLYDGAGALFTIPRDENKFSRALRIEPGSNGVYDYRLEVFLPGLADPVLISDSSNNPLLAGHQEELPREDCNSLPERQKTLRWGSLADLGLDSGSLFSDISIISPDDPDKTASRFLVDAAIDPVDEDDDGFWQEFTLSYQVGRGLRSELGDARVSMEVSAREVGSDAWKVIMVSPAFVLSSDHRRLTVSGVERGLYDLSLAVRVVGSETVYPGAVLLSVDPFNSVDRGIPLELEGESPWGWTLRLYAGLELPAQDNYPGRRAGFFDSQMLGPYTALSSIDLDGDGAAGAVAIETYIWGGGEAPLELRVYRSPEGGREWERVNSDGKDSFEVTTGRNTLIFESVRTGNHIYRLELFRSGVPYADVTLDIPGCVSEEPHREDQKVLIPQAVLSASEIWIGARDQEIELLVDITENDRSGLSVGFYADGDLLGIGTREDTRFSLKLLGLHEGFHFITAKVSTPEGVVVESNEIEVAVLTFSDPRPTVKLEAFREQIAFGERLELMATASDPDGGVLLVEFLDGINMLRKFRTSADGIYRFSVEGLAAGKHNFRARVTDNVGQVTMSLPVSVFVESIPNLLPAAGLEAEPTTANHGALVELHATAKDSDGEVDRVEFYADNVLVGIQEFGPQDRYTWNVDTLTLGEHKIVALAVDDRGGVMESNSVTVRIVQAANLPPSVSLEVSSRSIVAGVSLVLTANATDFNGPVTLVEFFDGDLLLGEDEEGDGDLFRFTIDSLGVGEHSFRARATDLDGDVRFSVPVIVSVLPPPNQLPQVSLVLSSIEVLEGSEVVLSATAMDPDGAVSEVAFYAGPTLLHQVAGTGHSDYTHALSSLPEGEYAITVSVTDDRGGVTVSEQVLLAVVAPVTQEPPPTTQEPTPGQEPPPATQEPEPKPEDESPVVREIVLEEQLAKVEISVRPPEDTVVYVLEEQVLAGTEPSDIGEGGVFNPSTRMITWGPYFDQQERTLTYSIVVPDGGGDTVRFRGTVSIDGVSAPVGGVESVAEEEATARIVAVRVIEGDEVTLTISPGAETLSYAVEERVPAGLTAENPTEGGIFDVHSRTLRWGPFFDNKDRSLSYQLSAQNGGSNLFTVSGTLSVDGVDLGIEGDTEWRSEVDPVASSGEAVRLIESGAVRINVEPNEDVVAYALEELVPTGLSVSGINHGGVFDLGSGKIKWGPFFDPEPREFHYEIQSVEGGEYRLSGIGSFNGTDVSVGGHEIVTLMAPNDGGIEVGPIQLGFRIFALPVPGGGVSQQLELEWNSEIGVRYSVEFTNDLAEGWDSLEGASVVAVAETTRLLQPLTASGATLFRVVAP